MNKLVTAAVVLGLVLLALPRLVGSMTETRVRDRVAAIDASQAAAAELTSFERGWFGSKARIELRLVNGGAALGAGGNPFLGGMPLPIVIDFAHGPFAMLDGVHFGWSKMVARVDAESPGISELQQTLGVPYLFEFRGRTGFAGGVVFDADAPPFNLPFDDTLVTFSGATLAGSFAGRHLDADVAMDAVAVTWPAGAFTVTNVRATADNDVLSEYVVPGEAGLSIERIAMTEGPAGGTPTFEAANLRLTSSTTLDATGALLDTLVAYDVDSVRFEDNELTAATLGLAVRNLDVAALEAYQDAVRAAAEATPDPAPILATLEPQLERALAARPSVTLDPIRFRFEDEPFEGRVELTTNADRLPPPGTLDLDNPLLMLGLFDTNAEVRLSQNLARQLATLIARMQLGGDGAASPAELEYLAEAQANLMLTMLTGQGVLIEEGDGYKSSLQLAGGQLTLNGNPLPFGLP